jgi:hypothetical protein
MSPHPAAVEANKGCAVGYDEGETIQNPTLSLLHRWRSLTCVVYLVNAVEGMSDKTTRTGNAIRLLEETDGVPPPPRSGVLQASCKIAMASTFL